MSSTTRLILVFVAAAVGALIAPDVFHVLPLWLQIVAGAVSAGLAGAGIVPPQYVDRTAEVEHLTFDHPVTARNTHEPYPSEVGATVFTRKSAVRRE